MSIEEENNYNKMDMKLKAYEEKQKKFGWYMKEKEKNQANFCIIKEIDEKAGN